MADTKEVLHFAVELGDKMLRSGAEIYRVEDTILKILSAFNVGDYDVYVLSNGIFASANENRDDACSVIRHVPLGQVNLSKIAGYNQIARDLCSHEYSIEEARAKMEEVYKKDLYPAWLLVIACGIGSGTFGYLFGGRPVDALLSCLIGFVEQLLLMGMLKHKISMFIRIVFTSAWVCVAALFCYTLIPGVLLDKVIIGAIMPLVPGIAFTTSIRDFHNEDHLSGTIHLINALLIALCIAVGICIPILIYSRIFGIAGGALL